MNLLSQLMGTPKLSDINDKVDNIIHNLSVITHNDVDKKDLKSLEDVTGNFLGLISKDQKQGSEEILDKIFQDTTVPSARLQRYSLYDELHKSVPLIQRILTVYISNIVPKNPVNDTTFIFHENDMDSYEKNKIDIEELKNDFKLIIDNFGISKKYKKIILPNRLKYGDYFVEIVNIEKHLTKEKLTKILSHNSLLTECESIQKSIQPNTTNNDNIYSKVSDLLIEFHTQDDDLYNILELDNKEEKDNTEEKVEELDKINTTTLSKIVLRYHKPHSIIILETKYNTCLGYLEVSNTEESNINTSIASLVQKITNSNNSISSSQNNVDKLIRFVISKIVKNVNGKSNDSKINSIISSLDPSVFNFIKRLIIEQDLDNTPNLAVNRLKVRFIPPKNMVHFNNPDSSDYAPFSASVVDPLLMPGKLYMLTQMSNIITKLSRSSIIRKWTIDTGPSKMSKQHINRLKREIYNTRVTLNDLGSFKSISKILSDFRDMFVISQNGRTPVDMSIENTGDPNVKTEDLKDLRSELVSLSGIPAPYLGMHDVIELREQLSNINQNFATEISNHQDNDIKSLNELIYKIAKELIEEDDHNPADYVRISLIPPITLLLQLIEGTLTSVGNISGIFNNLQIPVDPYHLLEQYVPHIDWTKFKDKASDYKLKDNLKKKIGGEQQQGGGGSGW